MLPKKMIVSFPVKLRLKKNIKLKNIWLYQSD